MYILDARRLRCTALSLEELYHDLVEKKCKHIFKMTPPTP